jgi:hypothetical protein
MMKTVVDGWTNLRMVGELALEREKTRAVMKKRFGVVSPSCRQAWERVGELELKAGKDKSGH